MLQKKPCCPAEAVRMVKLLTLPDGIQVGILNLDTILKQVADLKLTDIQAVKKALLERVKADNYISSRAEDRYAEALFQEYQKYIMAQIERKVIMTDEQQFIAGVNTHENVIFSCFGGASNTGITSGLACLEAVKELGLTKAAIMCLGGLPTDVKPVFGKTRAAKKIITVDGCPFECARKVVEQAGFNPVSIVLTRDIGMKKKGLSEDIGKEIKDVMDYISDDEVKRAKELIVKTTQE